MSVPCLCLEKRIVDAEYYLTVAAILPITGQIAAVAKIILGIIQIIGGLIALVLSTPFLQTEDGQKIFFRAGSHIVNGFANIGAALVEGTPIIGNIVSAYKIVLSIRRCNDGTFMLVGYKVLGEECHGLAGTYSGRAFYPI